MRERMRIPPLHLLSRLCQMKTFITNGSLKLFSNLCLKKMTPNALIMVMSRGSMRLGLYFAKCYIKYQMVPILKSLLSQKTRQTKGWAERMELHPSADKAVYSNDRGTIRRLVINSLFSCCLLRSPTSHYYNFRQVRESLHVSIPPLGNCGNSTAPAHGGGLRMKFTTDWRRTRRSSTKSTLSWPHF